MRAFVLILLASACAESGSGNKQPSVPPEDAAPPPKPSEPPEDLPDEPEPPSLDDLSPPKGVPGLTQSVVDQPRSSKASRLNTKALGFHNKGELEEAIRLYIEALTIDPGNVLARYNLSCAYNLSGQPEAGLALLKQFYDTGCEECRERLARASEDAEWHDHWDDPRFVQLVAVSAEKAPTEPWWKTESPCPEGTELTGAAPPEGEEIYCATASGRRQGMSTKWNGDTLVEQGEYERGRKQGPWLLFGETGALAESGQFERGRKVGPWSMWSRTGEQLVDGRYKSGKQHGPWTYFTPAGAISKTELWSNGRMIDSDP